MLPIKKNIKYLILFYGLFFSIKTTCAQNWQALGAGADQFVTALFTDTTTNILYIGGQFKKVNGFPASAIASWNGTQIDSLKSGVDKQIGMYPGPIRTMARFSSKIFVGGDFTVADNFQAKYIASWDGIIWDSTSERFNNPILQLLENNNKLYACGAFSKIGSTTYNSIAKFDGINWSIVGDNRIWNTGIIRCMCFYKGELYIGGRFFDSATGINNIAKWNGSTWISPGTGINGPLANVVDMKVYKNELYVGGLFNKSDGNAGNSIMKWDSIQWHDVGGSMGGVNSTVQYIQIHNSYLYASGIFNTAGNIPAMGIARWDGFDWCGLGTTFDNAVGSMAFLNDTLYIGGGFWTINSDSMHYISKWIGGSYVDTCGHINTGINESQINNESLNIYPNPATNQISLEFTLAETKSTLIIIKNVLGQTVKTISNTAFSKGTNKIEIDVSEFSIGIYFVQLLNNNKLVSTKFIKQ